MRPQPVLALTLFAGAGAVWLAATIDPTMFLGAACGPSPAEHCWRCIALAADVAILAAAAVQQIVPKPAQA
jgi:hypothetical protein